jgi:membrane associated rhomboid family serine protease
VFASRSTTVFAMLSHRPYMRGDYQREKTSALTWLLSAIIGGFLLQLLLGTNWFSNAGNRLESFLGLTLPALEQGRIWTLFTYSFLHSPAFIFHVVGNSLALYFLGRELIPMLGTRRFLGLYGLATLVGGLAWSAAHWRLGSGELIGATAAIDALFIVFACFFPNQPMTFLLFFVVPVTIKPKHIAWFLVGFDAVVMLAYELPGTPLPFDATIASSAHLGGMLTGLLYYRFIHSARWFNAEDRANVELPRWIKRNRRPEAAEAEFEVNLAPPTPSRADLRAEVDRILDKINSEGLGALTAEEKRMLDEAKDLLSRK